MIEYHYRADKAGIPVLNARDIDKIGREIIEDFCPKLLDKPGELDTGRLITEYLGLNLEYQYLSNNGIYLGMTVFEPTDKLPIFRPETGRAEYLTVTKPTIFIDGSLTEKQNQEHREHFTEGHEFSHGFLHRDYYCSSPGAADNHHGVVMAKCRVDFMGEGKETSNVNFLEWQANKLASVLLMPKAAVLKIFNSKTGHGRAVTETIKEMVRIFNVSDEAAFRRLSDLGVIDKSFFNTRNRIRTIAPGLPASLLDFSAARLSNVNF